CAGQFLARLPTQQRGRLVCRHHAQRIRGDQDQRQCELLEDVQVVVSHDREARSRKRAGDYNGKYSTGAGADGGPCCWRFCGRRLLLQETLTAGDSHCRRQLRENWALRKSIWSARMRLLLTSARYSAG